MMSRKIEVYVPDEVLDLRWQSEDGCQVLFEHKGKKYWAWPADCFVDFTPEHFEDAETGEILGDLGVLKL